ncbi:Smr/MutS family protein [Candidatus Uhrbacteria bacterium]|nr:Smr/MutS family protein [Candidatus Uhrbacteria bacterium]
MKLPHTELSTSLFAAQLGEIPTIDLHNLSPDQAEYAADRFIDQQFLAGTEAIKIIHGRGKGILRKRIHQQLEHDAIRVAGFSDAECPSQQGAATIVILHSIS